MGSRTELPPDPLDRPRVDLIEIVTVPEPAAARARGRVDAIPASLLRAAVAVLLVAALAGVAVVEVVGARDRHGGRAVVAISRKQGAAGVAAAYGYPRRCLTITIAARGRDYARADFSRTSFCGRYTWAPTAIFHRVAGVWYRVLDAVQYRCPVDSLPMAIQEQLGVCSSRPGLAGIH